ncbi:SRPBCC family protein [Kineococcus indalonis]|uniref:SRPBCC family protein n=1 Tax=Kineococcus indalonis TaxID=2696566 RepID=UPI001413781E|nr:SRPBCC family protein [Kineococcus indalonis]NAZ85976.1 SRPBCC family protein [Kineococcus indalonis]
MSGPGARRRGEVVFTARGTFRADAGRVFDVLTDWPRQSAWVPATVVQRRGGPAGEAGERFAGVSRLGPLVLDDEMVVVSRTPPAPGRDGLVRVRKVGTLLGGVVDLVVAADGPGRARVQWRERILLRPPALALLARLGGPLPALLGRLAFQAVLRAARADVEGGG